MTNFLPWRHLRQQSCWRLWMLFFVGSVLIALVATYSLRSGYGLKTRALETLLASDTAIQQQLSAHRARWQARQVAPSPNPQRVLLDWQPALVSLASAMPEQAWLTQLRYQPPRLTVTGFAATPSALSALAESLKLLPGFMIGPAGEMQQDAQGRWTFSFTLTSQG
ncbi:PilN domain-containing protein [Lelliottia sp. V89_10]|uniref:PilN domain-containing protein n=1 Tax=Lelliottia wanjuensis TaxID=3050585 RepID=UPI00249DBFC2|nr:MULTISPECIES: PilN domain-containing protein [unclassified Lelliottia]MDI3360939.1 PilN domain-containing protein [Lelliottia sp. V89_13]MDK9549749.1 PilN domain-containing protein [Lelliottia sp. V89_5]MDK9595748.1 PilN domain-containing protein [Lelliottia sp. V89_10]